MGSFISSHLVFGFKDFRINHYSMFPSKCKDVLSLEDGGEIWYTEHPKAVTEKR
jgi:hypothetical protein